MSKKRRTFVMKDTLLKSIKHEEVREVYQEMLNPEQLFILDRFNKGTFTTDDRKEAYKQGFRASEIGEMIGLTRAAVSKYLNTQLGNKKELGEKEHKENREKLEKARWWYLYVYKSDLEGDYRQIKKYLPKSMRTDGNAWHVYKEHGGEKLEKDYEDKRQKLSKEKEDQIIADLKEKSFEQVCFYHRIHPVNVTRIAEENNIDIIYEQDLNEYEYTEKLNTWLEKKKELNKIAVERRKEERRKARQKEGK